MKFDSTITVWDEAIPLGNGALGCLIWGNSNGLRLSIDRCDIWDCTDPPQMTEDYSYKTLVELAKKGDVDRIRKITLSTVVCLLLFRYAYCTTESPECQGKIARKSAFAERLGVSLAASGKNLLFSPLLLTDGFFCDKMIRYRYPCWEPKDPGKENES